MGRIIERLKKILYSLRMSFQRFPEVALVSVIIAIIGITLNHESGFNSNTIEMFQKTIGTLIIMVPLASFGKLVYEKNEELKWRMLLDLLTVVIGVLFYFSIPQEFNGQFAIQAVSLFLSFTIVLTLIHHYKKSNYSIFVLEMVSNFFITILFSLVLFLGTISILFTIEQLFEISVMSELYFDVFIVIATLFSVTYFFARLPKPEEEMEIFMYPNVLKGLINYIVIPLISVYTGILYLYFIRIIILKRFPINLLSHLVMWYALISVIVLFFINKIKDNNKVLEYFYSYFPLAILLPLMMLFLAIGKRIANFSVTPLRYYVLVIGIWATFSVLYIKFSKRFKSNIILVVAVVLMIGSLYGPQSAFTLSRNLQENRFVKVLERNQMFENGEIISRSDLPQDEKDSISNFIRYFSNYHEFEEVDILPDDFELNDMKDVFGFEQYYHVSSPREIISYNYMNRNMALNITNYNYLIEMDFNLDQNKEYSVDDLTINYISNTNILSFQRDNSELIEINLVDMIESFDERHDSKQINSIEEATIQYNTDEISIKFIIGDIHYQKSSDTMEKPYSRVHFKTLIK